MIGCIHEQFVQHVVRWYSRIVNTSSKLSNYSFNLLWIFVTSSFMLVKQPKRKFLALRRGGKFFLIAEGAIFLTSYLLWAACNRSQQTRKYFHDRPYLRFVLTFYYTCGNLAGSKAVQEYDRATWEAEKKLSSK